MKNKINFAIKSWKGKRPINQDALACAFNKADDFCAIVCDGVGSVPQSEKASQIVASTFSHEFAKTDKIAEVTPWFKATLAKALNAITKYGKENSCPEIATTIALLIVSNGKFYTYNIGDTRIYAIKKYKLTHEIKQYSYDHNYKNYLITHEATEQKIQAAKAKWYALTNLLDASNHSIAKFDANSGKIEQHTYFLICTDGLYGYLKNNKKYNIATSKLPMPLKMSLLNLSALTNGSDDNISGILVSVR